MAKKTFKLGPIQRAWVRALKSGKYRQCKGSLAKIDQGYCCLGVLCSIAVKKKLPIEVDEVANEIHFNTEDNYLPREIKRWVAIRNRRDEPGKAEQKLAELNDKDESFKEIARYIEKHAAELFTRSV